MTHNTEGYDSGTDAHRTGHSPFPYTPFPDPEHVHGHLGALTCPYAAQDYLLNIRKAGLEQYKDIGIEWILMWP